MTDRYSAPGTSDFPTLVRLDKIPGYSTLILISRDTSVGTSFNDLWNGPGDLVFPTANESWEFVSDNANDTAAGAGARELSFTTLDENYVETIFTIATNGTTPVVLPLGANYFRMNNCHVSIDGTDVGSLGNITIRVAGGGAIRGVITPDNRNIAGSHFTVPIGKRLLVISGGIFPPKGEDINIVALEKPGGVGAWRVTSPIEVYEAPVVFKVDSGRALPEKSEFKFTVKAGNPSSIVTATLQGYIIDNSV